MASFRSVRGQPRFLAATAIFAGLSAGVIGFALVGMRTDAIAIATVRASDTATILADDLANLAASYDVTLRDAAEIVNNVAQGRTITSDDAAIIERALASRRLTMNRSEMIAVADQNGEVVAAANDQGRPVVNVSDREYFERLRDDRAAGLYMSRPLRSKTTGAWVIVLARRIETASGRFLGVAFAGVDVGKLMRPGPEITQNGGADVSLFYFDGTIATLEPPRPDLIGTLASTSPQWRKVAAEGGGLYHSWGLVDPRPKYVAVRQVGDYPFFVNVAVTDEAALATWRTRALTVVVGGIMGIALVLALLYSQMRLTDRLSRSRLRSWMRGRRLAANAAELLDIRKRFGLTLDYISQGMAMFDASEKLVFANRCYAELYGLEAEELRPGMDVREIFALRIAKGAYARGAPQEYLKVLDEPYAATRLDFLENGRVILVREKETDVGGWAGTDAHRAARQPHTIAQPRGFQGLSGRARR